MRPTSRGAGVVPTSSRGIKRRSTSHNPEGMHTTSRGPAKSELHPRNRWKAIYVPGTEGIMLICGWPNVRTTFFTLTLLIMIYFAFN